MTQGDQLPLERCPHCNIAQPYLARMSGPTCTSGPLNPNKNYWSIYVCHSCGGVILTCSLESPMNHIREIWPSPRIVSNELPERARDYLSQAVASIHAPAGAVMLTASAVDAMLKDKGYREGSLYKRIDDAAAAHLITAEMAAWAHEIRLDANDQRHADINAALPDAGDAKKVIEFASALGQFLYELPARVIRGRSIQS